MVSLTGLKVCLISLKSFLFRCSCAVCIVLPSALWRCWSGGRKGIRPVKLEWWGAGVVIFLERGADLHMAQLMQLPLTVCCFSIIQIGLPFWYRFTWVFLKKGPLNACVCVRVCVPMSVFYLPLSKTGWLNRCLVNNAKYYAMKHCIIHD